jgi:hypothetical protein
VVTADIDTAYTRESGGLSVDFISLRDLVERLANLPMLGP